MTVTDVRVAIEPSAVTTPTAPDSRREAQRWVLLVFVALAQLMLALDATIVNIALPSAQAALHFSDAQRQWVITAYTLAFGGLLLVGGRVADLLGRKRAFLLGMVGFAAASALSGAAVDFTMLIAARALQGACAAVLAPTVLSVLGVTFSEPRERARAFAVYGGIAGSGGAIGLVLGGVLAQFVDWRWCLYVNLPIAAFAVLGVWQVLPVTRPRGTPRIDTSGVLLGSGGLVVLVFACAEVVPRGWNSAWVLGPAAAGAMLLTLFVLQERQTASPMLPFEIVLDRNRAGAYLSAALAVVGIFGSFLLLTYHFQVVLGFSPLQAGLAFLPLSGAVLFSSGAIASRLLPRVPPRVLVVPGFVVAAAGMGLLTQLPLNSDYLALVVPAEVLLGMGIGCVMVPAISTATRGVGPRDAGVAAAVVNTAQQIGASLGTAVLNTVAAAATAGYLASHGTLSRAAGLVYGYSIATGWGAAILVAVAVMAGLMMNADRADAAKAGPSRSTGAVE